MRLPYFFLICLLGCLLPSNAVFGQADSLRGVIAQPPNDTADLKALYALVRVNLREAPARSMQNARDLAHLASRRGKLHWAALGYRTIGTLHWLNNAPDSSRHYNELALETLGDPATDPRVGVGILVNLGSYYTLHEKYDEAAGFFSGAYELALESGYDRDLPKILNNLGVLFKRLGRDRSALRTYEMALQLKEEDADTVGMANTLLNLGGVRLELDQAEAALIDFDRASDLYRSIGRGGEVAAVELSRGVAYYERGEFSLAEQTIEAALALPEVEVEHYVRANALLVLADVARKNGEANTSLNYLREGYPLAKSSGINSLLTNYERSFGHTYRLLDRQEEASAHFAVFAQSIDGVHERKQLDVYQETVNEFQAQLREAEIERQELIIARQRQRQQLMGLGLASLGLLATGIWLLLRSRLNVQKSEALRLESERKSELEVLNQQAELNSLRSMIEGQEVERKRVAKDLHDGLGGLLATVKARLSAEAPTATVANQLIDRACTEVRRIAHNMMPQTLALSGLSGSVRDIVAQLNQRGLDTELEIVGQPDLRLDEDGQAMLLRILQELTHNVVKHAGAEKLFIQLLDQPNQLLLTVEDDGKGFNPEFVRSAKQGIGLENIDSRVAYLRGTIQYDSSPGHGTNVTLTLPL
ncbi:MAG: tetratricopeptide repeat protein [Lewinella sp.]